MKLEKREITLNEYDSLKDMYYMEKMLVGLYAEAAAMRRETALTFEEFKTASEGEKETLRKRMRETYEGEEDSDV